MATVGVEGLTTIYLRRIVYD